MIRVLGDRVLVALPPEPETVTTASGLVLTRDPDKGYLPTRGIVMQVGERSDAVSLDAVLAVVDEDGMTPWALVDALERLAPAPLDVQVGDCVLFSASAGDAIEVDGLSFVILHEDQILAVVEPKSERAA